MDPVMRQKKWWLPYFNQHTANNVSIGLVGTSERVAKVPIGAREY